MSEAKRLVLQYDDPEKKETVRKLLKFWGALENETMPNVLYEKLKEAFPEDFKKFE